MNLNGGKGYQGVQSEFNHHCKTTDYSPNIMKALKGGSARFLYKAFPEMKLNYKVSLWGAKVFIATEDTYKWDKMAQRYRDVNKPIRIKWGD